MKSPPNGTRSTRHCAIYTRKSSEEGLDQTFNSLDAQREACEAFIKSQAHEGWVALSDAYDDGGFSGGTMERPALAQLLEAISHGEIDVVVVYKVDRLSRSLADFVRLIEAFDRHGVSFVSVTQQFNTSTPMGRLTLNVLLSFAQFEREVTSERIRDKIAASKKKGMWMGGTVPLGYDRIDKQLVVNPKESTIVHHIYERYLALGCVRALKAEFDVEGYLSKPRNGAQPDGSPFSRGALYTIMRNPLYVGKVRHLNRLYAGQHEAILDEPLWQRVQDQLARNRHIKRTRSNAKTPSLLAGLVFDDRGNVMSATQAHKGSRRYRYYISQALLQYRESEAGSVVRLPANQLERLVIGGIQSLFTDGPRLLSTLCPVAMPAATQELLLRHAEALVGNWPGSSMTEQIEVFQSWRPKVTVARDEVRIELARSRLLKTLLPDHPTGDTSDEAMIRLIVPVELKRSGIETRLVVGTAAPSPARSDTITSLQQALNKALIWNENLLTGKVKTMREIAKREDVTQRFIAHRIQLAFLAPDIMRRIVSGDTPDALKLESFKNRRIPLNWQTQRHYFQLIQ